MKNYLGFAKQTNNNLFVRPDFVGPKWQGQVDFVHPDESALPGVPLPRAYYFPYCARSLGQKVWRSLGDTFLNNTCVMNTSGTLYEFGNCNPEKPGQYGEIPQAAGNTFWVPGGGAGVKRDSNASFRCGAKELHLDEAQAVGYEEGSSSRNSLELSAAGVDLMIRQFLDF